MRTRSELQGFNSVVPILQATFRARRRRRAIAMTTTTYLSDPFEGDINPGSASGQKLYTLGTADRKKDELLLVAQENVSAIMSAFRHDANSFGWGSLINNIIAKDNSSKLKILDDFQECTLELVKQQAVVTWNDENATATTPFPTDMTQIAIDPADSAKPQDRITFYRRVRSKMIAKRIENSLTPASWKTLFSKRKHFTWTSTAGNAGYDGPTMLHILIAGVNPSTRVGVSDLKSIIRSTKLVQFQYNVVEMCDSIMTNYELIGERGGRHEDIVLDLFDALLSGKNDVFNRFVERSRDDWEVGSDITHDSLVSMSVTKYNNMVKLGRWKQAEPKDATIVALTTQIRNLENKISHPPKASGGGGSSGSSNNRNSNFTLDEWRIKFEGKEKTVDSDMWYWCSKHVMDGVYDGMYVKHSEEKHDEWLERKKGWKKGSKDTATSNDAQTTGVDTTPKLTLSNNLKAALVTNFNCSEADANSLWSEVVQNSAVN